MLRNKKITSTILVGLLSFNFVNSGVFAEAEDKIQDSNDQYVSNVYDDLEIEDEDDEEEEVFFDQFDSLNGRDDLVWGENSQVQWVDSKCKLNGVDFKLNDDNVSTSIINHYNSEFKLPDKIKVGGNYYVVNKIEDEAFYFSNDIVSLKLPNSITNIGDYAFGFCRKLDNIEISEGTSNLGDYSFSSCSNLSDVKLSDTITYIGEYAFSSCKNLDNINIPKDITEINEGTFYYCKGLSNISIPNKVENIGAKAFYNCTNLESIVLPDSVECIENQAFKYCKNLKSIWTSSSQFDKFKSKFTNDTVLIESNLYNREDYSDDVIKIKADDVKCFEKCSNGRIKEQSMSKDEDGNFLHDPSRKEEGTKYYYYEVELDGKTYESPVISVTVNSDNVIR